MDPYQENDNPIYENPQDENQKDENSLDEKPQDENLLDENPLDENPQDENLLNENPLDDSLNESDNSKNDERFVELSNQFEALYQDLYSDPSQSFDTLFHLCVDYCSIPPSNVKYQYINCFYSPLSCINEMIQKKHPENYDKLINLFNEFYEEDKRIRENNDSEQFHEKLFEHHQNFTNSLQIEIDQILSSFPKYSAKPIDIKVLTALFIIMLFIYVFLRFYKDLIFWNTYDVKSE